MSNLQFAIFLAFLLVYILWLGCKIDAEVKKIREELAELKKKNGTVSNC